MDTTTRRWLRTGGFAAVVVGGGVGWVLAVCLALVLLATTLLGSLTVPFWSLWIVTGLPLFEVVLADSALIVVGAAMVAASRR